MYKNEDIEAINIIASPQVSPDLELMHNEILSLIDIVANRVSDFRNINDKLFSEEPTPDIGDCSPNANGAVNEIFNKLSILRHYTEALMPEVKRLRKLI